MALRDFIIGLEWPETTESSLRDALAPLAEGERLDVALELVGIPLNADERAQDIAATMWRLILKERWWKVQYNTVHEFTAASGIADSVAKVVEGNEVTKNLKPTLQSWQRSDGMSRTCLCYLA